MAVGALEGEVRGAEGELASLFSVLEGGVEGVGGVTHRGGDFFF